jgi:UDP-glucose 4-epimerase
MRVLVTGGAGFIGSHLVKRLVRDDEDVTVLDNLSTGRRENLEQLLAEDHLRFVCGDIRDQETVRSCVKEADRVVHLAAIASVPYSIRKPAETHDVNVEGTLNVLRACDEYDIAKLVYASSCAVYGEPRFIPVTEEHQFSATSPYAESKIASEAYCQLFREKHHLQTACLRAFNVYGANQYNSDYGGVITQFMERLKKQQAPIIYGDGEQSRDFIYVDDVVETIARIIRTPNNSDGTYNLGSGRATTINQLVRLLQRILGDEEFRPIYAPARPGDIRHSQADIGKARRQLGFGPLTSLEQGLERLVSAETNLAVAPVEQRAGVLPSVANGRKY